MVWWLSPRAAQCTCMYMGVIHVISLYSPRAKSGWILWPPGVGLRANCRPLTGPSAIPVRASPSTRVPSYTMMYLHVL